MIIISIIAMVVIITITLAGCLDISRPAINYNPENYCGLDPATGIRELETCLEVSE